jgi:hypothetical protein
MVTHGLGANPKNHSEIKASIKMLMTDQSVDSDKRLRVADYFSHRFSDGRQEILGFDPLTVLQKIRNGEKLDDGNKQQLSKMLNNCSDLTLP